MARAEVMMETDGHAIHFEKWWHGVAVGLGDGYPPVAIDDTATFGDVEDWITQPIQRAVVAARLRQIADMLLPEEVVDRG